MTERLQKVLAQAGYGSRRTCEAMILAGRVLVNGRVAKIGIKVDPAQDDIRLDNERIHPSQEKIYLAFYKPIGVISSHRAQGGKNTIIDYVDINERYFPVGRLDVESEGLMLLTNDGEMANRLLHPRYGHEKEYRVLFDRTPDEMQLKALRWGVVLADGTTTLPARLRIHAGKPQSGWVNIVLRQGRKRQIRAMATALGLSVRKLIRVRIGPLRLGRLQPGQWRKLSDQEIRQLKDAIEHKKSPKQKRKHTTKDAKDIKLSDAQPPTSRRSKRG